MTVYVRNRDLNTSHNHTKTGSDELRGNISNCDGYFTVFIESQKVIE